MKNYLKSIYTNSGLSSLDILKSCPDFLLYDINYSLYANQVTCHLPIAIYNLYKLFLFNQKNTDYGLDKFGTMKIYLDEVMDIYKSLPIITSDNVKENLHYFANRKNNWHNSYNATTGGTGRGITKIILSNASYSQEWAHMNQIWSSTGYNRKKDSRLSLRGVAKSNKQLFSFNAIYNEYIVNDLFLSDRVLYKCLEFIETKAIEYIHLYPSNLEVFYDFCFRKGFRPRLKGIFTGSEGCNITKRVRYKDFFNCPIVHWYGLSEKVVLAADDNCSDEFRVFTSYCFISMEKEQSGIGEIVGSTFVNSALPLVKYSTGDYGQVFDRNNQLFIKNIKGRWGKDFLYCNDGTRISSTQLNFHEVIFENILYYQIVQFEFNQIKFKILPAERISVNLNDLIEEVANLLMVKLPNFNIEIIVCQSSDFELSTRGKVKMIVQKIQGVEYTKSEE